MNWFAILKQFDLEHNKGRLEELEKQFSNSEKAIGYLPITWSVGIEDEIRNTASRLGLEYKMFESLGKAGAGNGNSFANGGHFMWNASKIEPMLNETEFQSVDDLIAFVAHTPYIHKPYRSIIDNFFGTPNIKLNSERREERHKNRQRGFE